MTDGRLTNARGADMSTEPESFLSRWARRKREAAQVVVAPTTETAAVTQATPSLDPMQSAAAADARAADDHAAASAVESAAVLPAEAIEELPPVESLDGLNSDYVAFFKQPVEESVRRAALRKLFSDPHFNVMDRLDIYIDDYTHFEPIPEPLRQQLISAEGFLNRAMPEAEARLSAESTTAPKVPGDAAAAEPGHQPGDGPEPVETTAVASVDRQDDAPPAANSAEKPAA